MYKTTRMKKLLFAALIFLSCNSPEPRPDESLKDHSHLPDTIYFYPRGKDSIYYGRPLKFDTIRFAHDTIYIRDTIFRIKNTVIKKAGDVYIGNK